ncbi:MAG: 3-hydroxy-3-methylglutaryl-CoA reductase, partial [Gaiellaceae bacterium]
MRWPRRNDTASIDARRAAMGLGESLVTSVDLEPFAAAAESLVGVAVIPVSAAPVEIDLGRYELSDDGDVLETGRGAETVHVPLAHSEGGLTASLTRGALAAGPVRTHVLYDRITRASCFVCADAAEAIALARWIEDELPAMQEWLASSDDASLSRRARLREVKTHVVGPMCHVLWRWTTGDAIGPNMMTRNSYVLNMAFVKPGAPVEIERVVLEANMGGDKKPSYEFFQSGHGKTVIAETTLTDEAMRRVLRSTAEDLEALAWAGTHGAVASGMQSVAFTPASAIAAIFAATGQDLGMVGTSSMAHGTERRIEGGLHAAI